MFKKLLILYKKLLIMDMHMNPMGKYNKIKYIKDIYILKYIICIKLLYNKFLTEMTILIMKYHYKYYI